MKFSRAPLAKVRALTSAQTLRLPLSSSFPQLKRYCHILAMVKFILRMRTEIFVIRLEQCRHLRREFKRKTIHVEAEIAHLVRD